MQTYTAAQWALLLAEAHDSKVCMKMTRDVEADLLYCSGADPVTVDANDYIPREITVDQFALGDPSRTGLRLQIDDADAVVEAAWDAERFSGNSVLVTLLLKPTDGAEWTSVYSVDWKVRYGRSRRNGDFELELHSAVGLRPRAGLMVATRGEFPYAPEPGQSVRIGGYYASFGGGGGGGGGGNVPAWIPSPWEI
jgi:hypothetical protein